ncbi:MAG TPA: glycosyl hydrolase family 28 protein [Verrucomicrobiae bacterium]|nr:glycosyl hydrolase family 28 protein [Verrucomicrobiae bacterium]
MMKIFVLVIVSFAVACGARAKDGPRWESQVQGRLNDMAATLSARLKPWPVPDRVCPVEDFGAVGDGHTLDTGAINRAVIACAKAGGGVVRFSKGDYLTGTIEFRSGVMLEVAGGARILGSTNLADYPDHVAKRYTVMDSNMDVRKSLLFAEGCDRIGIRGSGEINGQGALTNFPGKATIGATPGRPFLLRFIDCRRVVMDGITLRDAACWMENYLHCEDLILQGLKVENQANWNNDGMDIDGCRNVIVRDCWVNSEDDGICFKGAALRPMENVLVEDSKFYSTCNALKFGTDSQGDFRNVLIRNVEVGGPAPGWRAFQRRFAISGISWEVVDGATLENVTATNIHIVRVESPLFLRLGNRGRVLPNSPKPGPGKLRRIIFDQITGDDNGSGGSIFSGIPGARIEDVVVRDLRISVAGGGKPRDGRAIPEKEAAYPEAFMFGPGPASGFWIRHAQGVQFFDIRITPTIPDGRPCFLAGPDTPGLTVDGKTISSSPSGPPLRE